MGRRPPQQPEQHRLEFTCSSEVTALARMRMAKRQEAASSIREIAVTNSHLTKTFVQMVFYGKCSWPNLERLYLQHNHLSNEGMQMIAKCISEGFLPKLHTLNVTDNQVGDIGAAALAEIITSNDTCLRNLYLYDNCIGDIGAEALSQCCKSLRELFLWGNKITDTGRMKLYHARYDGLLLWIDLAPKKEKPMIEKPGSLQAFSEEMGHQSLQNIHEKQPIKASHYWTPRRAPRTLNGEVLAAKNGTPRRSKTIVMVPIQTSRKKKDSQPALEREQSFKFEDLLNKAKAMDSPSPGIRRSIPKESPPFRVNEKRSIQKEQKKTTFKSFWSTPSKASSPKQRTSTQVSPTSPIGEFIETTRSLDACTETPKESFQTLLNKARALEGRNLRVPYLVPDLDPVKQSPHPTVRQIKERFERPRALGEC